MEYLIHFSGIGSLNGSAPVSRLYYINFLCIDRYVNESLQNNSVMNSFRIQVIYIISILLYAEKRYQIESKMDSLNLELVN